MRDKIGAVKFRLLLGPVGGARKPAGPLGGDRGAVGRTGERSRGVDLAESRAESRSLKASCVTGERSRVGGERGLDSRALACVRCKRSGWIGGDERREVFPEVRPEDRSESRAGREGDRALQFDELGPVGARSLLRSRLLERGREPRAPAGGDLLESGDLARAGRSRSYGDLDLLLGGDLALRSSSLRGEYRLGLLTRGGDRALDRQLSLNGERSRRGVLDRRRGDRSRPGCQVSVAGGDLARSLRGDLFLSPLKESILGGERGERGRAEGRYDSPAPILVTSPSPLFAIVLAFARRIVESPG